MESSDRQIVELIRQGSESAFEELFRAYCEPLCTFAEGYVRSSDLAEDLVHEVFCDVWDRRMDFLPRSPLNSYLFRAVRNKALNWLKHRRVQRRWQADVKQESAPVSTDAAGGTEYAELRDAVVEAIDGLSERQRAVFLMARHHDLTYAEIGAILGISRKSVENHMGRALRQLREHLSAFLSILL